MLTYSILTVWGQCHLILARSVMPGHCILSALHPPSKNVIRNSQMWKRPFPHMLTASWTWIDCTHSLGQSVYWCKSLMALNPVWGIPPDGFIDLKLDGTMTDLQVRALTDIQCRCQKAKCFLHEGVYAWLEHGFGKTLQSCFEDIKW